MKYRTQEAFNRQEIKAIDVRSKAAYRILLLCISLHFLGILLLGIDRHWSFKTSIEDTGVFDQAIWNCLQNGTLLNTINLSIPINWLGFHFHPLLFLFVPLYKLYPGPEWLILAQALAISATALPIYRTALRLNYTAWQAFYWSMSFLLNPFVLSAAQWDFHPVAIATPFIAWSVYFLLANAFKKLLFCALLILLCQEQFGILTMCIGVSHYCVHKNTKQSLLLITTGALYTGILFVYVFPALSPTGAHIMMSTQFKALSRYHWLGETIPEILYRLITAPVGVLKTMWFDLEGYSYVSLLLLPYGILLPLLGFDILLIGLSDFGANALSLNPLQRNILGYHSLSLVPIIINAAMVGFKRLEKSISAKIRNVTVAVTFLSFSMIWANYLPYLLGKNSFWQLQLVPSNRPDLAEIHHRLPEQLALSVQANIGPHFTQRRSVYAFPSKTLEADAILLRLETPGDFPIDDMQRFDHYMTLSPENYLAAIRCLLSSENYHIDYFKPPWLLLRKGKAAKPAAQPTSLTSYLDRLERRWEVKANPLRPNLCTFH